MLPEFNSNCNPGTNAAKVPKWGTSAVSTRWWHSARAVWRIWLLMIITVTKQKGHRQHAFWVTSERRNPAPCIWKHHFYNAIEHEHHFNAERTATKKSESTWTLLRIWQCHGDVCCCLTHSMDGKIFASRQKKKEKKRNIHVSWWQWQSWLKDVEASWWPNNSPSVSGEAL